MSDSTPSPQSSPPIGLMLTREQTQLLRVLRVRDGLFRTRLAEMYLAALHALSRVDNPERCNQAAHSMREVLEKLAWQHGGPSFESPGALASKCMKEIESELELAQNSDRYDREQRTWRGEIDPTLQPLLKRVEESVAQLKANPDRRARRQRFVREVIPAHQLPPEEEARLLDQWKKFAKFYERVAHHNHRPDDSREERRAFDESMKACAVFLLHMLRFTLSTTLDQLDDLIARAESDA